MVDLVFIKDAEGEKEGLTAHTICANMHIMNWDDLRILEVCVRCGSFLKASEELSMSHTSLSRRITKLEDDLKVTLLHRSTAGITLTDIGISIFAQAQEMASAALTVKNTTQNAADMAGKICFETIDATAFNLLKYLGEFSKLYPQIEIDLRLNQNMVNLDRGDADVVLRATNAPPDDYVGYHLADHAFGIFCSTELLNQHPATAPLEDLPWVMFSDGWSDDWLKALNISPKVVMRVNTAHGLVQAVRAGIGVSFLACYGIANDENFVCLRAPRKEWHLQIWLLSHKTIRRNERVKTFVRFLRQKIVNDKDRIEGRIGSPMRSLEPAIR
ncbi:LysR family transcriptional regulator [Kordiimonas sp. SCSIO 12610]|uniref:LysR family transcriptional regulator n=1 Tax=Kordiimonas sp. SCSIO 12610 TaxID=2829597 RepID=UPI002109524A|nr:LysR family transcriptional regulator [Kordiimonas sp. SCSIO 12610]UTW56307.1 LysR family transcriptional regulator [Kordiimonas sp. SCSIO 12610]